MKAYYEHSTCTPNVMEELKPRISSSDLMRRAERRGRWAAAPPPWKPRRAARGDVDGGAEHRASVGWWGEIDQEAAAVAGHQVKAAGCSTGNARAIDTVCSLPVPPLPPRVLSSLHHLLSPQPLALLRSYNLEGMPNSSFIYTHARTHTRITRTPAIAADMTALKGGTRAGKKAIKEKVR